MLGIVSHMTAVILFHTVVSGNFSGASVQMEACILGAKAAIKDTSTFVKEAEQMSAPGDSYHELRDPLNVRRRIFIEGICRLSLT